MMVSMSARDELREVRKEGLLGDLLDPLTWRTALYVLLAFPLGALTATLLTSGVVMGVLTLPVLLGAVLLLGALWLVGGLADVQRGLARLLGVTFPRPALPPSYTGVLPWLRGVLSEGSTYRALLFHVVQFPLAALSWAVLGTLLALSAAGLSAPLWLGQPGTALTWKAATVQAGTLAQVGGCCWAWGACCSAAAC
ncbi:sensor domain-containing protein [Deinococcus sp. PESE-38]